VCDIDRERLGASACVDDCLHRPGRRRGIAVQHNHPRTDASKTLRKGLTEAIARAGHDGNFSIQPECTIRIESGDVQPVVSNSTAVP
jgi:hypothetical protein